ncbi:uncharacterized protein LOC118193773, partial [Stegodyphus dumicola]|uniref:uncharacterized protein LOC118193773 n=1 Tax=Stegodyphus dumicola TaxID=202533 RepID=UPI0015A8944C
NRRETRPLLDANPRGDSILTGKSTLSHQHRRRRERLRRPLLDNPSSPPPPSLAGRHHRATLSYLFRRSDMSRRKQAKPRALKRDDVEDFTEESAEDTILCGRNNTKENDPIDADGLIFFRTFREY